MKSALQGGDLITSFFQYGLAGLVVGIVITAITLPLLKSQLKQGSEAMAVLREAVEKSAAWLTFFQTFSSDLKLSQATVQQNQVRIIDTLERILRLLDHLEGRMSKEDADRPRGS